MVTVRTQYDYAYHEGIHIAARSKLKKQNKVYLCSRAHTTHPETMFSSLNETLRRTSIGDNNDDELWSPVCDAIQHACAFSCNNPGVKCKERSAVDGERRSNIKSAYPNKVDCSDKRWSVTCDVCRKLYLFHYSRPYLTVIICTKRNLFILLMMRMENKIKSLDLAKASNTLTQLHSSILIYQFLSLKCIRSSCAVAPSSSLEQQHRIRHTPMPAEQVVRQANLQIDVHSDVHRLDLSSRTTTTTTSIKKLRNLSTIALHSFDSLMNSWTLSNFLTNHSSISNHSSLSLFSTSTSVTLYFPSFRPFYTSFDFFKFSCPNKRLNSIELDVIRPSQRITAVADPLIEEHCSVPNGFLNYVIMYNLVCLFICYFNDLFRFVDFAVNRLLATAQRLVHLECFKLFDYLERPKLVYRSLNEAAKDHLIGGHSSTSSESSIRSTNLSNTIRSTAKMWWTALNQIINQTAQLAHRKTTAIRCLSLRIVQQFKLSIEIRPSFNLKSPNKVNSESDPNLQHSHRFAEDVSLSNQQTCDLDQNSKLSFNEDVRWPKKERLSHWLSILLILLSITSSVRGTATKRNAEKKILDSIIGQKYDSRIRPSGINNTLEKDGPCIVNVNIFVRSIGKISDLDMEYSIQITFREQWNDSRLEFNSVNNITYLTLTEPEKIWKPDLFFSNEKEGHFHNIIMPNVLLRIYPNGQVLYSIRISLVLSCPMNLKYYPLDKQVCQIKMGSCEYSCIYVDLVFKREFSYYLIQIYIPNSMLVIVSWVSFWLDPNAIPARVSLGVTTLLTMATQISGINASLPPVSYTKAIDVWTGVCLTFVFGALIEFALVNYASRKDTMKKNRSGGQMGNMAGFQNASGIGPLSGYGMTNAMGPLGLSATGNTRMNNAFMNNMNSKQMKHIIAPPKTEFSDQQGFFFDQNDRPNMPIIMPMQRNRANDMRSCEVTINSMHGGRNFLSRWLASFPSRSKRIDVISRIIFPVMFGCFNIVYWTVYLLRDDRGK